MRARVQIRQQCVCVCVLLNRSSSLQINPYLACYNFFYSSLGIFFQTAFKVRILAKRIVVIILYLFERELGVCVCARGLRWWQEPWGLRNNYKTEKGRVISVCGGRENTIIIRNKHRKVSSFFLLTRKNDKKCPVDWPFGTEYFLYRMRSTFSNYRLLPSRHHQNMLFLLLLLLL